MRKVNDFQMIDDKPEDDVEGSEGSDEAPDPRLEAGWQALAAGDVAASRAAVAEVVAEGEDGPAFIDALMLDAACDRESGQWENAVKTLERVGKADPEWAVPELWIAEIFAGEPDQMDQALKHARRALDRAEDEADYLDALALKAHIEIDLGRSTEALRTLSGLPPADVPLEDPIVGLDFAQLLIDAGDPGAAQARLETLSRSEPELSDAWYLLGVTAELRDDEQAKRAAWVKTRELDVAALGREAEPEDADDAPVRLSEDDLVVTAEEALAELPDDLRAQLTNVPIVVTDLPALGDVENGLDPRLLGLFRGIPHAERETPESGALTEIVLFRSNIERAAPDPESMQEEVRTTLLHEAGHYFGLDEVALAHLGLD